MSKKKWSGHAAPSSHLDHYIAGTKTSFEPLPIHGTAFIDKGRTVASVNFAEILTIGSLVNVRFVANCNSAGTAELRSAR